MAAAAAEGALAAGAWAIGGATEIEARAMALAGAIGPTAAALGPAAVDAPGVEVPVGEGGGGRFDAPTTGRNEPHESSPFLGRKRSN